MTSGKKSDIISIEVKTNLRSKFKEVVIILVAKIKDNLINCYDNQYSRELLKQWSNKNIIKCPVCGNTVEYCHGLIHTPYFRHKDKAHCEYLYSEPETEEHIRGKIALFEWVKQQDGVSNCILEAWIPETKQRPDIMFEYNGSMWVIEFQCSPISSEQIQRHELYVASGINDIWICGVDNYGTGRKHMEKISNGMFNFRNSSFRYINNAINPSLLSYSMINTSRKLYQIKLSQLNFKDGIFLNQNEMIPYIEEDIQLYKENEERNKLKEKINNIEKICVEISKRYEAVIHNCEFEIKKGDRHKSYFVMLEFRSDITVPMFLFIKDNVIDVCETSLYRKPYYGMSSRGYEKRVIKGWNNATKFTKITELEYNDIEEIYHIVTEYLSSELRKGVNKKYSRKGKVN